jgi:hypothetical protein
VITFTLLHSGHVQSSDSPAFSVSLETFNMNFSFLPVDGVVLLSRMKTNIEGKAGFLKKFEESTEIMFSDYRRMPEIQDSN